MWYVRGSWEHWEGRLARAIHEGHLSPMVIRSSLEDYCYHHQGILSEEKGYHFRARPCLRAKISVKV